MEERGIITARDRQTALECVERIISLGASAARITLDRNIQNNICTLDGNVDKIAYNEERSIRAEIFMGGRYGTFSTNRLEKAGLDRFLEESVRATGFLAPDPCRRLPDKSMKACGCTRGDEMLTLDGDLLHRDAEECMQDALEASAVPHVDGVDTASLETEYSDLLEDTLTVDSDGFEGRQTNTLHSFFAAATAEDSASDKYSGYCKEASPFLHGCDISGVARRAVEDAASKVRPESIASGKYDIVVDNRTASRLFAPIIDALGGYSLQQNNSFLKDCLGKKMFPQWLDVQDRPVEAGKLGSCLFDSEGVREENCGIIRGGVVEKYFVDTYIAGKTGLAAGVEAVSRPCIRPYICNCNKKEIYLDDILCLVGSGLLVTGFVGGNCNGATGNFSFGIEGFLFRDGKTVHPVREALMTGNMISLWNSLAAAGSDPLGYNAWQIPALAFQGVDINA